MAVQDDTLTKINICSSGLMVQGGEDRDQENGEDRRPTQIQEPTE